ncbi:MAG: cytochrome-ba3 oxidase subunit [Halorientalis sp.]
MGTILDRVPPRVAVGLALLALVPVFTFGLLKSVYLSAAVTTVNVVLIGSSLYLLFSPHEHDQESDTHTTPRSEV